MICIARSFSEAGSGPNPVGAVQRSSCDSARRAAAKAAAESAGGSLEAYYFAFGSTDAFAIVDLPNNAAAAALALTVSGAGAVTVDTTVLLTPEEIDAAAQAQVQYTPPGQ